MAFFMVFVGIAMILLEKRRPGDDGDRGNEFGAIMEIAPSVMYRIGLCQALSLLPGISRLAIVMGAAMLFGLSRAKAVDFSFFISMPIGVAGSFFDLCGGILTSEYNYYVLIGFFIINIFFALFFRKMMISFLKSNRLNVFGYYRIAGGLLLFLLSRRAPPRIL
jgi:undecaprenyl-diphosphatase